MRKAIYIALAVLAARIVLRREFTPDLLLRLRNAGF